MHHDQPTARRRGANNTSTTASRPRSYLVEDAGPLGLQVFTMAVEGRDTHLEGVCAHLREAIREERDRGDPVTAWRFWLAQRGHPGVDVHETPDGALRAVLPARAFVGDGAFQLYQLGSFETWQRAFLQLWCADAPMRRTAVLDRILAMVRAHTIKTHAELDVRLDQHATLLEVPPPAAAGLRDYARQRGDIDAVAAIDALEGRPVRRMTSERVYGTVKIPAGVLFGSDLLRN